MGSVAHIRTAPREPPAIDDAALVERAREGDRWAEDALFRRHSRRVAGTAARLLGSRQDVDDVVHDAFVAAFEQIHSLREPSAFGPWLMQIAVTRVRRVMRRRRLTRALGLDNSCDDAALEQLAGPGLDGEAHAELALIDGMLRRLPADQRIAWMLRYVEGYRLSEVATIGACSLATAKRRIAAAAREIERLVDVGQPEGGAP